jgi:hypothetical protein
VNHFDASAVDKWLAANFGVPLPQEHDTPRAYSTKTVLKKLDVSKPTLMRLIKTKGFPSPKSFQEEPQIA